MRTPWIAMALAITSPLAALPAQDGAEAAPTHLGRYAHTLSGLARPTALAFGPVTIEGTTTETALWVCEDGRGDVPPGVRAVEWSSGADAPPTLARIEFTELGEPAGVAVDERGRVFVSDRLRHTVWRVDPGSAPVEVAGRGSEPGHVLFPGRLSLRRDGEGRAVELVVVDGGNRRVQRRDLATGAWTVVGGEPLVHPSAACFLELDGGRTLAIADHARQRIDLFTDAASGARYAESFSDWGFFPSLVSGPGGLSARDGRLYVADTENHRVQVFDASRPTDPVDGLLYTFGVHAIRPGEGEGALHYPSDLALSPDGDWIALAEPLDDRVQVFGRGEGAEPEKDPLRSGTGPATAHLGPPISASGQFVATMSPESHMIQILDTRLETPVEIAEIFGFGTRLGMLREPVGLWLGREGRELLVTDVGRRKLARASLRVDPTEPLKNRPELAIYTDEVDVDRLVPGRAVVPGAVTVAGAGDERRIVVANRAADELLLLDDELTLVGALELTVESVRGLAATDRGTVLVAAIDPGSAWPRRGVVVEVDLSGRTVARFGEDVLGSPAAVLVLPDGVLVSDAAQDCIRRFVRAEDGTYAAGEGFGSSGMGRAQFHEPRGLARLDDGRFIVLDHGNHRGQIFDAEGNFVSGFGGRLYLEPLER